MGRALLMRLLQPGPADDRSATVEPVERAWLQPPPLAAPGRAQLSR
jgi:hypothetical protein